MNKKKVGKRIKEYREKAGITQERLSEIVDVSVTSISNIERGIYYPTFENFIKISNALKISSDILLADVIDCAYIAKASELSEKLEKLSPEARKQLIFLIESMIKTME